MNKKAIIISWISLLFLFICAFCVQTKAQGELTERNVTMTVNVLNYGADGTDGEDDAYAFIAALEESLGANGIVEVDIPEGTYYIERSVPIYSNTLLKADPKAVIINRSPEGIMIFSRHLAEDGTFCPGDETCTHGEYSQIENVTIDGGTWDSNNLQGQGNNLVFQFRHAHNITIKNTVCKNATNHFINISGVDTACIENVVCRDAIKYLGRDPAFWGDFPIGDASRYNIMEAVHIDYLDPEAESKAFPLDGTPSKNIKVSGCTFDNVFAGIGTHHYSAQNRNADNIEISNNTFLNIKGGNCINLYGFKNTFIHNNTTDSGQDFVYSMGSASQIKDNQISSVDKVGIYLGEQSTAQISGNEITNTETGICFSGNSLDCTVNNNVLKTMANNAILVSESSSAEISDNKISDISVTGIRIMTQSTACVSNNTITNVGLKESSHGVYVSDESNAVIQNNTISKPSSCGIVVLTKSAAEVKGNTISETKEHGINIAEGINISVSDNQIKTTGKNGIVLTKCSDAVVENNKTELADNFGIFASECPNVKIHNNIVNKPGANGINVYYSDGSVTRLNKVNNAKGIGIKLLSSNRSAVNDNTVKESVGTGIQVSGENKYIVKVNLLGNTSLSNRTGNFDIRIGEFTSGCIARDNTVGKRGFSAHASAGFTEINTKMGMKVSLSSCRILLSDLVVLYDGNAKKPGIDVKFFSASLVEGIDYTVSCKNNTKVGTATAVITGKGNYQGSVSRIFRIYFATPVLKSATSVSGGIKVTWGVSKGAEKYRVFRKAGTSDWEKIGDTTSTSYTDNTVKTGVRYSYSVRCLNGASTEFTSDLDPKGITGIYIPAPSVRKISNINGGVKLSWGKSAGAAIYRVFRKTGAGSWKKLADTTNTSYVDNKVQSGKKYSYTVRCMSEDAKNYISAYNTTGKTIVYIAEPVLTSVSNVKGGVKVIWAKSNGAAKYRVFRKTGSGSWKKIADITSTSYIDKSVKSGTQYSYAVRCLSKDSKSYTSAYDTRGKTIIHKTIK